MARKAIENNFLVIVCEGSRKEDGPSGSSQGSEAAVVLEWSASVFIFCGDRKLVETLSVLLHYPFSLKKEKSNLEKCFQHKQCNTGVNTCI